MFRLIHDWLELQQSEIPSFIHQRTWPHICVPGNIRKKVQINKIFHGQPSVSSHSACKDWGGWRGKSQEFFFSSIFPSPQKLVWTHCLQEIKSKSHLHILVCVGKGRKNRNSAFGKEAQSWERRTPWKKEPGFYVSLGRIILIIFHFQALENYFQAFERPKIMLWEMAKLF